MPQGEGDGGSQEMMTAALHTPLHCASMKGHKERLGAVRSQLPRRLRRRTQLQQYAMRTQKIQRIIPRRPRTFPMTSPSTAYMTAKRTTAMRKVGTLLIMMQAKQEV